MSTAKRWWDAFWRPSSEDGLEVTTRYPFVYRDGDQCRSGRASKHTGLRAVLKCLRESDLLDDDLRADPDGGWRILANDTFPPWSRRWLKNRPAGAVAVAVHFSGGASATELIFFVSGNYIQELWRRNWFKDDD